MGQKVHPVALRLQTNRTSDSAWYSDFHYSNLAFFDASLRQYIDSLYTHARLYPGRAVSHVYPKRTLFYVLSHAPSVRERSRSHSFIKRDFKAAQPQILGSTGGKELPFCIPSLFGMDGDTLRGKAFELSVFHEICLRFLLTQYHAQLQRNLHLPSIHRTPSFIYQLRHLLESSSKSGEPEKCKLLTSEGRHVRALQESRPQGELVDHLEAYLGKTTETYFTLFPFMQKTVLQSAHTLAYMIQSSLEKKKSLRSIWTRILEEKTQETGRIQGIRIVCAGRLGGVEMARVETRKWGQTPLQSFSKKIDYANRSAHTLFGRVGIKVWISYS